MKKTYLLIVLTSTLLIHNSCNSSNAAPNHEKRHQLPVRISRLGFTAEGFDTLYEVISATDKGIKTSLHAISYGEKGAIGQHIIFDEPYRIDTLK